MREKAQKNAKPNHLLGQTSPYLLQHLYNPVDWHPWGSEALEKARKENKPLLVSIGYSACHWCHVMERESFEDPHLAKLMNTHFVCVKVDREERPDLDHVYMNAVQLISGRGGWPLNCFALPDGRPFWGGTYFPPEQWENILIRIAELFQHQHADLEEQAVKLTQGVEQSSTLPLKPNQDDAFEEDVSRKVYEHIVQRVDFEKGGTTGAPKFPLPGIFEFLLHYAYRYPDSKAWQAVDVTLEKMAMGGIYDQAGGGFARYSVDDHWKVPHFEKMLYDNAQLVSLYARAWKVENKPLFREVVQETIAFVVRELQSDSGTFYSALDADSEGEEGKFYVWTEKELEQVLGADAPMAADYYQVGGLGLWENQNNILLRNATDEDFAARHQLSVDSLQEKIKTWKHKLLTARAARVRPALDNKVLVSWNGLMISALAEAAAALENDEYLQLAQKAADFILENALEEDGKIYHSLSGSKASIDGFLEDYACMTQALISLYQLTFDERYLKKARLLTTYVLEHFGSAQTRLFRFTSAHGEKLAAEYHDFHDNVIPSANSIMAKNIFYLAHLLDIREWLQISREMLADMKEQLQQNGSWTANWATLWLHHQKDFYTISICGPDALQKGRALQKHYLPDMVVTGAAQAKDGSPLLSAERFRSDQTLIYPCIFGSCMQPVEEVHKAAAIVKA